MGARCFAAEVELVSVDRNCTLRLGGQKLARLKVQLVGGQSDWLLWASILKIATAVDKQFSKGVLLMRVLMTLLAAILSCSDGVFAQAPREIVNSIGMKFVPIPAGKYRPAVTPDVEAQESLAQEGTVKELSAESKEVLIGENLYLGATEVTREQYGRFADDIHLKYYPDSQRWWPRLTPDGRDRYRFKPEEKDLPVNAVGWPHADLFCRLLSELPEEKAAGRAYRLPTGAEWEYACLAGSSSRFSFGDSEEAIKE